MENEFKKISSAVPKESDFIDVILSLKEQTPTLRTYDDEDDPFVIDDMIDSCYVKVSSAVTRFADMFSKVYDEFPNVFGLDPLDRSILRRRFNFLRYEEARGEASFASYMMANISAKYLNLLRADVCDSLDKCKSLKRAAFARMLAVVRRCVPSLAFLDKVREYMANLDVGGEHASASAASNYNHDEGYTAPQLTRREFAENIEQLVDPQTLVWLEGLDRVPVQSLKDAAGMNLVRCASTHTAK
ncbi:unnamed protein product [Eruca vesicaria subsp. sativa]|uniref:NOG1 N-terminal helical domain-containing protein n=1 Tax=Eruca vesicaria subsp. sativa TaxID=29727 RepID=A0ABC8JDU2_ERUVS|nr:unnamed protein product [Eruca vesicaria subsp. sativa]